MTNFPKFPKKTLDSKLKDDQYKDALTEGFHKQFLNFFTKKGSRFKLPNDSRILYNYQKGKILL